MLEHVKPHGDCSTTINGRTMAEELVNVPDLPAATQDVIRQPNDPLYAEGHLAILKGNLAPGKAASRKSRASRTRS